MKKSIAISVATVIFGTLALGSPASFAGVVVNETETVVSGQPAQTRNRTLMIEGNKEKMVTDGGRQIITDLDKGMMDIVDPTQKTYVEMPFPPKGMMAQAVGGATMHASEFKKAGTTRSIAGYKCEDYTGSGKFAMAEFSVVTCVSNKVPGAADFTSFEKAMNAKLKDTQLAMPPNMPEGIPLVQDTTTRISGANMPNLPPEAAAQMRKQFANRPPVVTKTEVSKVESKKIAAGEFQVPAGFTRQEAPMGHPGMGGLHGMGAGGSGAPASPKP